MSRLVIIIAYVYPIHKECGRKGIRPISTSEYCPCRYAFNMFFPIGLFVCQQQWRFYTFVSGVAQGVS